MVKSSLLSPDRDQFLAGDQTGVATMRRTADRPLLADEFHQRSGLGSSRALPHAAVGSEGWK
jgi:hypothetical protein